jgi:exopolyphosphatase/guanosine-5'-triphosphate,3'-diphosphate pyrophosphatase
MRWSTSLELGSARLTEDFLRPGGKGVEAMQAHIQKVFQTVPRELPIETVIAMAGTATTLGAIDLGLTEWKPELVHGHRLTLSSLNRIANQLQQCTLEQKRSLAAVSPKRAEFLLAGARIIEGLLTHLQRADCTLTVRGLRFGILEGQHL